jgi:hypothetical protein
MIVPQHRIVGAEQPLAQRRRLVAFTSNPPLAQNRQHLFDEVDR